MTEPIEITGASSPDDPLLRYKERSMKYNQVIFNCIITTFVYSFRILSKAQVQKLNVSPSFVKIQSKEKDKLVIPGLINLITAPSRMLITG